MVTLDLGSLRQFTGRECRFVLDIDFGDQEPDEGFLRDRADAITRQLRASEKSVAAEQWVRTPAGWSGVLTGIDDLDDAEEWLTAFVAGFSAFEGRVLGGPRSRMWRERDPSPALTVHLHLTTTDLTVVPSDDRGQLWGVDPGTTRYVADQLLVWTHLPRGVEHLVRDGDWYVETRGLEHALAMSEAVERYVSIYVRSALTKPLRCREAAMHPGGQVVAQAQDPTLDWREQLRVVRDLLTLSPPRSDYGYIRHGIGGVVTGDGGRSWPHVDEAVIRYNQPLLSSFVPDAFGLQLLTASHLERARDLSSWDVTSLANGRYLVAAKDPEPWFRPVDGRDERGYCVADPLPDSSDVVREARADFGDMILTYDLLEAHNPWPADDNGTGTNKAMIQRAREAYPDQ